MSSPALIVLDGTHGEGGGALLRTALGMSALSAQPFRIEHVRGGTAYPGMDAEDLQIALAVAKACGAEMPGAELGAYAFEFLPSRPIGNLNGALPMPETVKRYPNALVSLSSLAPLLARAGAYSTVEAHGETYGFNALTYDYFAGVTAYAWSKMGLCVFPSQLVAGFGRDSLGEVQLDVEPSALTGIEWRDRGSLRECRAIVAISDLADTIAQRGVAHLERLAQQSGVPLRCSIRPVKAPRPGVFVTVYACYERGAGGAIAMGAQGVRMEQLAQGAFDQLFQWMSTDATADAFLIDQLLIPAVLAEGTTAFSTDRLSARFLTMVWVIKQFLPIHITVRGQENGPGMVTIRHS